MFSSYDQEFPSLERKTNPTTKITTRLTISLGKVGPDGKLKAISKAVELQEDISHLEEDFKKMAFGEESNKKEREIRKLKA
ncbi:hypothetical protein CR513_08204, partial [Mucuna pruriens]